MLKGMFYTRVARVIAAIAFFLGILGLIIGLAVATGILDAVALHYVAGKSSGQAIDRGIYYIIFAVVIGVLSEISQSLSKNETNNK